MGQNASKVIRQVKDVSTKLSLKQPTSSTGTSSTATSSKLNQQVQQVQVQSNNKSARDIAFGATTEITTSTTKTSIITTTNNYNNEPIIDPFSGFQRGTGKMSHADIQQEQFLSENQQQEQKDSTITSSTESTTTAAASTTTTVKERVMPTDLLKFINDAGPMRMIEETQQTVDNSTNTAHDDNDTNNNITTIQLRQKRLPKHLQKQLQYEQLQEQQEQQQVFTSTSTSTSNSNNLTSIDTTSDKSQSIFYDKTRVISSMRLAKNVEGFETKRTTSFSNRNVDNENDNMYDEYDGYDEIIESTTEYDTIISSSSSKKNDSTTGSTTALTTTQQTSSLSSPRKRRQQQQQQQQHDNGLSIIELYKLLSANNNTTTNNNSNYIPLSAITTGRTAAQMNLLSASSTTGSTYIGAGDNEENNTISKTIATADTVADLNENTSITIATTSNTSTTTTTTAATPMTTNANVNTNTNLNTSTKIIDPSIHVYTTALKYTHVPILMKDTDGFYIGSFVHNVSLLQDMKLKLLDTTTTTTTSTSTSTNTNTNTNTIPAEVKLVLQDIHEMSLKKPYRDETVRKQRQ